MFVWNLDGVQIFKVCTFDSATERICGTALYREKLALTWYAYVTPTGYLIHVKDSTNRTHNIHGSTFNLFLEVAAAIRRVS